MRKRRKLRAFTIIEILIAIMVISIALLGTVAAIAFGLRASDQGSSNTVAIQINRKVLELLVQSAFNWNNNPNILNIPPASITAPRATSTWKPVFYNPAQANWFSLADFGYTAGTADATKFAEDTRNYELSVSAVKQSDANLQSVTNSFYLFTVTTRWQTTTGASDGVGKSRWKSVQTSAYSTPL